MMDDDARLGKTRQKKKQLEPRSAPGQLMLMNN